MLPELTILSILAEVVIQQRIFGQVDTVEGWIGIDALLLFDCYQVLIISHMFLINRSRIHHIWLVALRQLLHLPYLIDFELLCFGPLLSLSVPLFDHLTDRSLFGHIQHIWHNFSVHRRRCFLEACLIIQWLLLLILGSCLHVRLDAFLTLDE